MQEILQGRVTNKSVSTIKVKNSDGHIWLDNFPQEINVNKTVLEECEIGDLVELTVEKKELKSFKVINYYSTNSKVLEKYKFDSQQLSSYSEAFAKEEIEYLQNDTGIATYFAASMFAAFISVFLAVVIKIIDTTQEIPFVISLLTFTVLLSTLAIYLLKKNKTALIQSNSKDVIIFRKKGFRSAHPDHDLRSANNADGGGRHFIMIADTKDGEVEFRLRYKTSIMATIHKEEIFILERITKNKTILSLKKINGEVIYSVF